MPGFLGGMGAPQFGGSSGGASAFTSPGINPMTLALLLRMQGGGMGGAMGGMGAGGQTMGQGGMPTPSAPQPSPPGIPQPPQGLGAGGMIPHPPLPSGGAMPQGAGGQPPNPMQMLMQSGLLGGGGGTGGGGIADILRSLFGGAKDFSGGTAGP